MGIDWPNVGFISAEFLTPFEPPKPWPLPEVEISDFGRQVAEKFLEQFESLFVPHGWQSLDIGSITFPDGKLREVDDVPHFSLWGKRHFDRFGNKIVDEVPFMRL